MTYFVVLFLPLLVLNQPVTPHHLFSCVETFLVEINKGMLMNAVFFPFGIEAMYHFSLEAG